MLVKIIISFIFLGLLLGSYSSADLIRLKSGKTVQCVIVGEDETTVNIRTEVGPMALPKSVIVTIERESPAMNQIRAGDSYMSRGDWEKARAQYKAAIDIDPQLIEAKGKLAEAQQKIEEAAEEKLKPLFQEGDRLLEKKQFDSSVEYFTDLLNHNAAGDLSKSIRRRLAKSYYLWGKDRLDRASKYEAIEQLKKAISFDTTFSDAYFLAASISKDLANRELDAIQYYTAGLNLSPTDWESVYHRGEVYARVNQLDNAIADFLIVYQKDTSGIAKLAAEKLMQTYWNVGKVEMDKQNWTNAINSFESAIQYKNDSAGVYFDLAKAYFKIKQFDRVTSAAYRSVALDNTQGDVYQLLGDAYDILVKYQDAVSAYRRSLSVKPDNYKVLCSLAEVSLNQGLNDDALDAAQRALKLDPNIARGYYVLGRVYEKKGMDQDAFKAFKKAVELKSEDMTLHLALGRIYKKMKQYELALIEFQTALKIDSNSPDAHNEMGLTNMALGNYFNAISDFQLALDNDSTFIQAYTNMGDAYRLKKNYESAIATYEKAIKINPDYPDSYLGLGIIAHDYQKDYVTALKDYKAYLEHGGKMNDQLGQWMKEVEAMQEKEK